MITTHQELVAALCKGWPGKAWSAPANAIRVEAVEWIDASARPAQAEVEAVHAAIVARPSAEELEAEVVALLNGGDGPRVDWRRLMKAKFISDLAHRLGKAPGQLTAQELAAERSRVAAIYKAL